MKYLILLSLFLVGCEDSTQKIYGQAILDEIKEIKQTVKQQNRYPVLQTNECVFFSKHTDTHAIASVTIPISGIYKIKYFSNFIEELYLDAGKTVHSVQNIMRDTCPGYKDAK